MVVLANHANNPGIDSNDRMPQATSELLCKTKMRRIQVHRHPIQLFGSLCRPHAARHRQAPYLHGDQGRQRGLLTRELRLLQLRGAHRKAPGAGTLVVFLSDAYASPGRHPQGFRREWINLCTGPERPRREGWVTYVFCDPAHSKKKSSDFTAIWVIGFSPDKSYVVLDMLRDRLNLAERTDRLLELVHRWSPQGIVYERYGMQADEEYIKKSYARAALSVSN
jgi:hypothetical protein